MKSKTTTYFVEVSGVMEIQAFNKKEALDNAVFEDLNKLTNTEFLVFAKENENGQYTEDI